MTKYLRIGIGAVLVSGALAVVSASGPASESAATGSVTIIAGDNWFCDSSFQLGNCQTVISVGDSVRWDYAAGATVHTTTECGASCDSPTATPVWDSGFMSVGDTFTWTFDAPGTFLYYCTIHPAAMRGTIIVESQPTPTPTIVESQPTPTPTPGPSATPTEEPPATPMFSIPAAGGQPAPDGRRTDEWEVALLTGAALAVAGAAVLILARRRAPSRGSAEKPRDASER